MGESDTVLKLRGLPWSADANDVLRFFAGCSIMGGTEGIMLMYGLEGQATGEAYVEFETPEDAAMAADKDKEHMGSRYIEVFRVKNSELDWILRRSTQNSMSDNEDAVVRLRGLPFGCSKEEIAQFFTGLTIVPNGIMLQLDDMGRTTGNAFVQFASPEISEEALLKHKETIGHRYVEIFRSSLQEAIATLEGIMSPNIRPSSSRPRPYDRPENKYTGYGNGRSTGRGQIRRSGRVSSSSGGGFRGNFRSFGGESRGAMRGSGRSRDSGSKKRGLTPGSSHMSSTGHSVHMRGLPFSANEKDVREFLHPAEPFMIEFEFTQNGRPTGEVDVDFETHEAAEEAMLKDKHYMGNRYIELFLNSSSQGSKRRNMSGFSFGRMSNQSDGGYSDNIGYTVF